MQPALMLHPPAACVHACICTPSSNAHGVLGVQDLEEEQVLLARLLHWLTSPHPDTHAAILRATHAALLRGGPRRLRTTLTALAFQTLVLHRWARVPCSITP